MKSKGMHKDEHKHNRNKCDATGKIENTRTGKTPPPMHRLDFWYLTILVKSSILDNLLKTPVLVYIYLMNTSKQMRDLINSANSLTIYQKQSPGGVP